jgi:sulfur carrier protein
VSARADRRAGDDAIVVNGRAQAHAAGVTIARLLELLEVGADARGVAVAVEGEVIPRREWPKRTLAPGERVEVVRAVQGG